MAEQQQPAVPTWPAGALCESGWTGDRCTFPLGHSGPHSNEGPEDESRLARVRIFGSDPGGPQP